MDSYRCDEIALLAHELTLSPLRLRLRLLAGIARVIDLVDPQREYPYSLVCYHVTGFRPRRTEDALLGGKDLIADLVELADALTAANPLPLAAAGGRLYDADDMARRFNVSTKTISRWRFRGLGGCWYQSNGEKPRLAFSRRDIERFVAGHQQMVRRGATFQLMTRDEKDRIIQRALELVAAEKLCLHAVTSRIAEETGRAIETLRYTLRRFDREHPDEALFDRIEQPKEIDENTVIYQAFAAGDTIKALAARFGKGPQQIRRIVTCVRAAELLAEPFAYVYNEGFDAPDAERQILANDTPVAGSKADGDQDVTLTRPPSDLPAYLQELYRTPLLGREEEARLFRQMNFMLHQAEVLRQQLPAAAAAVKAAAIAAVDERFGQAAEIKNRIIQANLRLVVSIAKRHLQSAGAAGLFELISDGNVALIRAVEKFDYAKGFRFSTYASWVIMRGFARSIPEERVHVARFQTGRDELLAGARDAGHYEDTDEQVDEAQTRTTLTASLGSLDERERSIIERHFGLADGTTPMTLNEIGRDIGLSKERVRQIELRALSKLRHTLGDHGAQLLAG